MKSFIPIFCAIIGGCLIFSRATGSHADDKKDASKAFNAGVTSFKDGKYQEAVTSFRKANELNPSWKILYNIGQCEAALKRYGMALEAFETYLVEGGDEVDPSRQEEVRDEIARLRDLSGDLEITGPEGAIVLVDGIERGRLPLIGPLKEAVGLHTVSVAENGKVLIERQIKISGLKTLSLKVAESETGTQPACVAGSEKTPEAHSVSENRQEAPQHGNNTSSLMIAGWITAGAGAAAAIAGAVTGAMAVKKAGELKDACPGEICQNPEDYELKDKAKKLGVATDVLLPVGGVAVAAGVVMLLVGMRAQSVESPDLAIVPSLGASRLGFAAEWRF